MNGRRVVRIAAISLTTLIAIGGSLYVMWDEPWYDRELIDRMQCKTDCIRRNETHRIADFFPAGMTESAAKALLNRNGFRCDGNTQSNSAPIICIRKVSSLVCGFDYTVNLQVSAEKLSGMNADSFMYCL